MGWKTKLAAWLVAHLILLIAMWHYARLQFPIRDGDPASFWKAASFNQTYKTDDDWFIYYKQGFHGQFLYRVPRAEALAEFPEAVKRLEQTPPDKLLPSERDLLQRWQQEDPTRTDGERFLRVAEDSSWNWVRENAEALQRAQQRQDNFADRYERIQRYWLNVLCESLYFSFLITFAMWPWLWGKSAIWWSIPIGAMPFLLFLPYYLGYATYCFTSAGPVGGVLYPHVLVPFRNSPLPWTQADIWVVQNMPHPLVGLTQTTGPMLSLSGGGGAGPLGAITLGAFLGVCIVAIKVMIPKLAWCYKARYRFHCELLLRR
jgi:hypothetical protein